MSVIIRLQNLPWSANALDIRQYFRGLSIPEGGVHIVGGELGDAFIAFSTDEDARQAFQLNNGKIKEVQINLLLSSRTEMQKVIEAARSLQTPFATVPPQQPAIIPPVATVQPILEIKKEDFKLKEESKSNKSRERRRSRSRTRSRERRDRSRDRRDRRRRDRSRSRDRRDRRRDRKDRSKSRERTRSRDRDSRRSRDKKRDPRIDEKNSDINNPHNINIPEINDKPNMQSNMWEQTNNSGRIPGTVNKVLPNTPSLLGNYPGATNTSLEDARRSLGLVTGLQNILHQGVPTGQSNILKVTDANGAFQTNDMKRDSWQPGNKTRFSDRTQIMGDKPSMGGIFPPNRSMLGQNDYNNQRNLPNMFQGNMGMRLPFNQDMGNTNTLNRPYLNRPSGLSDMMNPNRNMPNEFQYKKDVKEEPYRKDFNNRMDLPKLETCVQLRPYYGGYANVRRFFQGLHISNFGIKFPVDSKGKRIGVTYIKFVRTDARPIALRKTGQSLRGLPIEVTPLSAEEFDKCGSEDNRESDEEKEGNKEKDEKTPVTKLPCTAIVVEDIPSFAKEHDILKMFSDYSLLGIHIQSLNRRRMAYVQFNKEEDAEKAMGDKNKHFLGGKQLVVRPCSEQEFAEAKNEVEEMEIVSEPLEENKEKEEPVNNSERYSNDSYQNDPYVNDSASFDTDVILLTGMPPKTSDRDVIDFFSDIGLVPNRIHMLMNKFGPSGECYCEFSSPDEAIAALDKNGMPLGAGIVNVEPFPRREMERNLGFNANMQHMHNNHMPNSRFLGRLGPRPNIMGMNPRPMMPNHMMRHHPSMMNRYDGPPDGGMMSPGCVVSLENVPFKAGVNEILDFFENFELDTHNVLRRYNDNGTPTGDARVTFNSPAEARRAFEECKFKKIRDRTIFLRIL